MKTRVCRLYGQNDLRIEIDEVHAPGPGQALVAIATGGICGSEGSSKTRCSEPCFSYVLP